MVERRSGQRFPVYVATQVAFALVVAEAIAAALSLVTGDPWDWGRFWWVFFVALLGAAASSVAEALTRRGTFGSMNPRAQRKYNDQAETAQAMRTGLLPPSAHPDQWHARIRRHVRQGVVFGTLCTVLCVTAAVLTATAAHLNNGDDPVLWTFAVATLPGPIPLAWLVVRARRRGERLVARL